MKEKCSSWMTILFIGSLWGFLEATVGGLLHLSPLPIAGRFMAPIGFALLFWAMKNGLSARQIFCVSMVAAAFKFFDPFIFHMPFFHIKIINPANAIVMQGLCFAFVAHAFTKYFATGKGTALVALSLYPVSWGLFSLVSVKIFQNLPGAFETGVTGLTGYLTVGMVLTVVALSLVRLWFAGARHLDVARLPLSARVGTASILVVLSVIARALFG